MGVGDGRTGTEDEATMAMEDEAITATEEGVEVADTKTEGAVASRLENGAEAKHRRRGNLDTGEVGGEADEAEGVEGGRQPASSDCMLLVKLVNPLANGLRVAATPRAREPQTKKKTNDT